MTNIILKDWNSRTFADPSFLSDLERRLDAAERKYQEANLETQLKQLEEAKQRQVGYYR